MPAWDVAADIRLVRSLQLVLAFDELKMTNRFMRFDREAPEYEWSRYCWVRLVAIEFKD